MEFEIDMDSVDMGVVNEVIVVMAEAMADADHIDPTLGEMIVAIGELMRMLIDDDEVLAPVH